MLCGDTTVNTVFMFISPYLTTVKEFKENRTNFFKFPYIDFSPKVVIFRSYLKLSITVLFKHCSY